MGPLFTQIHIYSDASVRILRCVYFEFLNNFTYGIIDCL